MTRYYSLTRFTSSDSGLRAADADRERIAERLRTSHAEGRLDLAEFQERLERCYDAKTLGDLRELVQDLPRPEDHDARPARLGRARWGMVPLIPILIALIVVAAAIGHHGIWLGIPLLFLVWRLSWWRRRHWVAGARRGPDQWI
jgi:hypothetical protein